jgi:ribonuclease BN (tRNA processing enzyme)
MLGAHNQESLDVKVGGILVDDRVALDAGALTSTLTTRQQLGLKAVLVTHHHFDHIKDLVMLAAPFHIREARLNIYAIQPVYDALHYLLAYPGKLYTNFFESPEGKPAFNFTVISPLNPFRIEGYDILPVPVNHSTPAVGFQVTAPDGKKLFYTGDTGPGLDECWRHISPDLLIIECTASNRYLKVCLENGHMCPSLLKEELIMFRSLKGYLPHVVTTHQFPNEREDRDRREELAKMAEELNIQVSIGYEGLEIEL